MYSPPNEETYTGSEKCQRGEVRPRTMGKGDEGAEKGGRGTPRKGTMGQMNIRQQRLKVAREKGTHTDEEWAALVEEFGGLCARCHCKADPISKDHIIPICEGGSDSIDNLQPLCCPCNSMFLGKDFRTEFKAQKALQITLPFSRQKLKTGYVRDTSPREVLRIEILRELHSRNRCLQCLRVITTRVMGGYCSTECKRSGNKKWWRDWPEVALGLRAPTYPRKKAFHPCA